VWRRAIRSLWESNIFWILLLRGLSQSVWVSIYVFHGVQKLGPLVDWGNKATSWKVRVGWSTSFSPPSFGTSAQAMVPVCPRELPVFYLQVVGLSKLTIAKILTRQPATVTRKILIMTPRELNYEPPHDMA
jgi:hypothetical protein